MRTVPIGKQAIASVVVAAVIPMIVVATIRIPLKEMILKIVQALA